jgi:hypothetical protein
MNTKGKYMSTPIIINTGEKKYKNVEIDNVPFKVRNFGAGEQLRISQIQRDLLKLDTNTNKSDQEKALNISSEMIDIVKGLFDDGLDGVEVKSLFDRIDILQLSEIIKQIFGDGTDGTSQS